MRFLVLGILSVISFNSFSQRTLGKYLLRGSANTFIVLKGDSSFAFHFSSHTNVDFACGEYRIQNSLITFRYTSNILDTISCNTEKYNFLKYGNGDIVFFSEFVDTSHRPDTLLLSGNKLFFVTNKGRDRKYYFKKIKTAL